MRKYSTYKYLWTNALLNVITNTIMPLPTKNQNRTDVKKSNFRRFGPQLTIHTANDELSRASGRHNQCPSIGSEPEFPGAYVGVSIWELEPHIDGHLAVRDSAGSALRPAHQQARAGWDSRIRDSLHFKC